MSSSNCFICSNVCCRGGWNCGVLQTLNRRKIQLLKDKEEGNRLLFLDLSNLRLKSLPRDYFQGIGKFEFFHLNLSGNDFETLPWWTFQHLERCMKLELQNNTMLSMIYEGLYFIRHALRGSLLLSNCPCLDELSLNYLLLESTSWTAIDLSGCGIRKLHPKAFSRMDPMDDLDLSNNRIQSLVLQSTKLREKMWHLNLSENPIKYVDARVENLQLDSCGLNSLKGVFSPAVKQSVGLLRVTKNHLTEISCQEMSGFERLVTLGLGNNKIRCVEEGAFTQGCPLLEDLYLENNKLAEIPANFFKFQFVSSLLLQNNNLCTIHPRAFDLTAAHGIQINLLHNPKLALNPPPSLSVPSLGEEEGQEFDEFEDHDDAKTTLVQFLEQLFEAQRILTLAKKQSIFEAFHEELIMSVLEPMRMQRFVETYGMEAFMDVYA